MPASDLIAGQQPHTSVFANSLSAAILRKKYMLMERPSVSPLILQYGTQAAAVTVPTLPTAAQDNIDTLIVPAFGMDVIEMYQTTAQTLMPSRHATKGLEIGLDEVNNESVEYVPGGNHAANPLGYLAGTDPGVFIRATLEIADTSGLDQLIIGWRKQAAYVVPTSFLTTGNAGYSDFVGAGFSGSAAANLVKQVSDVGASGSALVTSSAFAWSDGEIHRIEIRLKAKKSSMLINGRRTSETVKLDALGAALSGGSRVTTATPQYSVTAGLFMIPFIFVRYDVTSPAAVYLRRLEIGPLSEVGLQPENRISA